LSCNEGGKEIGLKMGRRGKAVKKERGGGIRTRLGWHRLEKRLNKFEGIGKPGNSNQKAKSGNFRIAHTGRIEKKRRKGRGE